MKGFLLLVRSIVELFFFSSLTHTCAHLYYRKRVSLSYFSFGYHGVIPLAHCMRFSGFLYIYFFSFFLGFSCI